MKLIKLFVVLFAVSSFACTQAPSDGNYGVKIEKPESAQELSALLTSMGDKTELEATIKGQSRMFVKQKAAGLKLK